jgi:hypothetical protein
VISITRRYWKHKGLVFAAARFNRVAYQEWERTSAVGDVRMIRTSKKMIAAHFWTEGEWDERDRRIVPTDDVPGFAGQVWGFLKPQATGS